MRNSSNAALVMDGDYLISMTPPEGVLQLGSSLDFRSSTRILDLCCGYGQMLKLWNEAFGATGIGVDGDRSFIETGKSRLEASGLTGVKLIHGDVLRYSPGEKFDVVCCTERFGTVAETLALLEKHRKPGGKLILGRTYSLVEEPPKELINFDGDLFTLEGLWNQFRENNYYLTGLATGTHAQWERYITWSARRDLAALRKAPEDKSRAQWMEKWWEMYFRYRRLYEGWALFGLEKL